MSISRRETLLNRDKFRTIYARRFYAVTNYYTICCARSTRIAAGRKAGGLAQYRRISARARRQSDRDSARQNPLATARRYLRVFDYPGVTTYADAAELLGVSRVRVYQYIALLTKLPVSVSITQYLAECQDPTILRHCSERRLRPLTSMQSDEEKCHTFDALIKQAQSAGKQKINYLAQ